MFYLVVSAVSIVLAHRARANALFVAQNLSQAPRDQGNAFAFKHTECEEVRSKKWKVRSEETQNVGYFQKLTPPVKLLEDIIQHRQFGQYRTYVRMIVKVHCVN